MDCARRPEGFPETDDAVGKLKEPQRSALERLVEAFNLNAQQLDRLVNWNKPGSCKP